MQKFAYLGVVAFTALMAFRMLAPAPAPAKFNSPAANRVAAAPSAGTKTTTIDTAQVASPATAATVSSVVAPPSTEKKVAATSPEASEKHDGVFWLLPSMRCQKDSKKPRRVADQLGKDGITLQECRTMCAESKQCELCETFSWCEANAEDCGAESRCYSYGFQLEWKQATGNLPQACESGKPGWTAGTRRSQRSVDSAPPADPFVSDKGFVAIAFAQRMGNNMFQYASAYGIAKRLGAQLCLARPNENSEGRMPPELAGAFKGPFVPTCPRGLKFTGIAEVGHHIEDKRMYEPLGKAPDGKTKNIKVGEYLQSYKYFEAAKADIQRAFRFKDSMTRKVDAWFQEKVHKNASTFIVGIHIRGKDHGGKANWNPFLLMPKDEWFQARMDGLRKQYRRLRVVFVVCSDDPTLVTKKKPFRAADVVVADTGCAFMDMAILSMSDTVIYSLGTFGFWGAWLSDKPVYYENEFAYDHMTNLYRDGRTKVIAEDYYPSYWTNATSKPWIYK